MEKIDFINYQQPALNATNLNKLQQNVEDAIEEAMEETTILSVPIGVVMAYGGTTAPTNWLICDGSTVSRITYADLFSVIGTSFGSGDGSTTFNLPDLRSRVPLGKDSRDEDFDTIGSNYGEKEHTLTNDEMPTMNAKAPTSTSGGNIAYFKGDSIGGYNGSGAGTTIATITGGNQSHNIVQPSIVMNYIIKVK